MASPDHHDVLVRVVSIVGARPQFIKAWPVSRALAAAGVEEWLVHSGQHYDPNMSDVFFEDLGLAPPARHLGVGSGTHAQQTSRMLIEVERTLLDLAPDSVLVYGDTNTTLAGALAACKLNISVAHVEAGLRSFRREMPEEVNRLVADHCASLLLCPTAVSVANLAREGVVSGVHLVGDVMYDAWLHFSERARARSTILERLGVRAGEFYLATIHRAHSTDEPATLSALLAALGRLDLPVILPLHPRTRARLALDPESSETTHSRHVRFIEPVGYLDMLRLEEAARVILTDSGGVQKEAYFARVPCVTLRHETEWVETVEMGWNTLAGADPDTIVTAVHRAAPPEREGPSPFGVGDAATRIARVLVSG
jgi:UDP-GlcNAc3NAcA epimerase